MSKQKIEEIQNALKNVNISRFMIQCLFVINRDLIWEGGVENPKEAEEILKSTMNILKRLGKRNFDSDDIDCCLQKNIQYILKQKGVMTG